MNQRLPSGPAAILWGMLSGVGITYSVTTPSVVILPILFASFYASYRDVFGYHLAQ